MSNIQSRADLFESAAKMMRMCDEAGIAHIHKYSGGLCYINEFGTGIPEKYDFPIATVEGKPVFADDIVYDAQTGAVFRAGDYPSSLYRASLNPPIQNMDSKIKEQIDIVRKAIREIDEENNVKEYKAKISKGIDALKLAEKHMAEFPWNPPKPKTVIVEVLIEDAERCAKECEFRNGYSARIAIACHKAIKDSKK